uniref:F-BAR domain-containing protein n=1 Tax=Globisporangium ultimum (strain ATCC 200006 / CBS 805.95 / DAOM BR144) TaxID=431595 RepID=K3WMP0_GLOUD
MTSVASMSAALHDPSMVTRCISIPHLSFATDLLFSVDAVKTNCSHGLTTQNQLLSLLKSRVALEKQYASDLARIAQQSQIDELEHGTMREALGTLRAQYVNTSVQHRVLAKNLEEDVLKPIEALYTYNYQKAQNLSKLVYNIKKQAKAQENLYKKDYGVFEKQFRDAAVTFAAAMDAGFSSTIIENQYHHQLMQLHTEEDAQGTRYDDPSLSSTDPRGKSAFNNNSQKLVNWLLASDQQRKDNMCANTAKALKTTELSRRRCQRSWQAVEQSRIDMCRTLQSVLTEYQQIAEHRISNLATNLRKHVVFESSALANEQYDWQMIAGKIENVDFEGDIREFILLHRSAAYDVSSMTVRDLCVNSLATSFLITSPTATPCPRPLRKKQLEIADLAVRKIPFDYEGGNHVSLIDVLVTRTPATSAIAEGNDHANEKVHPVEPGSNHFGQLQIDCRPSSSSLFHPAASDEDVTNLRVALAQDVAHAITRAYELRVTGVSTHGSFKEHACASAEQPENNSSTESSLSSSSSSDGSSISAQSNDIEDEEGTADAVSCR